MYTQKEWAGPALLHEISDKIHAMTDNDIIRQIEHMEYLLAEMEAVGECGHIPPVNLSSESSLRSVVAVLKDD